ncbi:Hypothetical protein GSB_150803 [Giardia duodenalis]|uniref:Uncharacterized protein n=1 Tax=Giardia intestinalis TaxID=5741 RepID=V6U378_GIAIN|nr:Hypothetical protein GSB_150803 [Giardia intestinalis]
MGDNNQPPSIPFPPEPLYMGTLTTYSGPGHLGPVLVRNSCILHSNQRSIIQKARLTGYINSRKEASNPVYMPMRSFAPRALTSKPLIEACPFRVSPTIYKELANLEAANTACYPAHPFEAYNVECYYAASNFLIAEVSSYRHVLVSVHTGVAKSLTCTFKFAGVICSVYADRHLLLVRTTYEVYGAIIFSDVEMQVLRRKFSRCGIQDATKLFCQMTSGIYFYPVVHYVRMDRSISRVAASRVWADVPAISREIALCVTHWDGTVRAFVVSDDLLATARIALNAGETQGSSFNYRHRSTVFMVAELSLPKVQPYSLSATPMRYIPLLPPEPLPLFSGVYPDRIYIAYGDLLFFSTIPVTVSTFTGDASPPKKLIGDLWDCSAQLHPKPTLSNARECFCEVGDRTSFTAIQHCRNNHILMADSDFLWVFSEKNLIEPLIRLRHSLNKTAPIRAIYSIPLVADNLVRNPTLPFFRINEADTTVEALSGDSVTKSLELVLLLTSAQTASLVIGIDSDAIGIVFSSPYLLMQAPVQTIRLWRTPMMMKVDSDPSHLRALAPHGALLGSLDLRGYNYITGVSVASNVGESNITSSTTTHKHHGTCRDDDLTSAMATFASYYSLPELSQLEKASTRGIDIFVTTTKGTTNSITNNDLDTEVHEYARFNTKITLIFLSGERVTLDWSARGVVGLHNSLSYPTTDLTSNQEDAPLLSYEGLINLLQQQREDSVHTDLDDTEESAPPHSLAITCVYAQNQAKKVLSWISNTSDPHLRTHARTLLSQLTRVASSQCPCIPLTHLHNISLGTHLTGDSSSVDGEPCSKRLMDSNDWSEGIVRSLFPAKLFDYSTACAQEAIPDTVDYPDRVSEQAVLPSSAAGMALISQWRESEQPAVARLFEARDNADTISTPMLTDPPKSLPTITSTYGDDTQGEAEIHTQNIDFLVGLMKAVS